MSVNGRADRRRQKRIPHQKIMRLHSKAAAPSTLKFHLGRPQTRPRNYLRWRLSPQQKFSEESAGDDVHNGQGGGRPRRGGRRGDEEGDGDLTVLLCRSSTTQVKTSRRKIGLRRRFGQEIIYTRNTMPQRRHHATQKSVRHNALQPRACALVKRRKNTTTTLPCVAVKIPTRSAAPKAQTRRRKQNCTTV